MFNKFRYFDQDEFREHTNTHLFKILPVGVVSKNRVGACNTAYNILSWSTRDARNRAATTEKELNAIAAIAHNVSAE